MNGIADCTGVVVQTKVCFGCTWADLAECTGRLAEVRMLAQVVQVQLFLVKII